ncbi:F-box-like protein [Aspergillus parasiticus SU-1]|uniref:F-box-like protein n=1 Tax=Aspergillus parasiticus (strain ATCC 56775 / NRRL 5862 / SRRC 143 / SU-1) TaxID=1403190 RepID=A0A0F0IDK0_ASPPU|nr:F-box-like protein [Aspergillus parasiticus SU-1]
MACSILSTPPEILHMIFAPLSPSDLYAVCLTCRNWHSIAEPYLYSQVEWTWTNAQNPPIVQFLRSIVHRPELASLVHIMILNGDSFERSIWDFQKKSPKLPVTEAVLDDLMKCIERLHIPYAEEWIQELRAGTVDAFLALLLSRLPNLRCLYLGVNFARESRIMGMMLRSALCQERQDARLPSFTHLQDVTVVYPSPGLYTHRHSNIRNTADALAFFYLPSVQRIKTLVDNPATFVWPGDYPPKLSTLASLDLTMLREGHLGQVLSVTRGLRKLRWDWHYREDLEDYFVRNVIDLDQIAVDLSHLRETLTDLTISAGSGMTQHNIDFPELTISGSFKIFSGLHMLERLQVPIPFLLGLSPSAPNVVGLAEALPKNIQWLTVTDDLCFQNEWEWEFESEYLVETFRSWLQDRKKSAPRLLGFRLLIKVMPMRDLCPEMIQGFRDMNAQSDIQVEIVEGERRRSGEVEFKLRE